MRYRLLGPFEVIATDGQTVAFAGDKERILLAALLLEACRVASTARLIDAMWGVWPPERAANGLQVHVQAERWNSACGEAQPH
ncbi:MAG TPA: hypothetical protein VLX59_12200 [Acidimicrobiales bacterium]|nr:hypothetical protein [Acidimicrobiales bacterium]